MRRTLGFATLAAFVAGCMGTTGGEVVHFDAALAGPANVVDHALAFTTGRGLAVRLTKATLVVGAVYMNRAKPIPVSQEKTCILTGSYVGEVLGSASVDLLSGRPTRFPAGGAGTNEAAVTGELWLSTNDINATDDTTTIAEVAGEVTLESGTVPFEGKVSLGANRLPAQTDPARPGAYAPCKARIVTPIPIAVTLEDAGFLTVRVDPRAWFTTVLFDDLTRDGGVFTFDDGNTNASSIGLAEGVRAAQGVYAFEWAPRRP